MNVFSRAKAFILAAAAGTAVFLGGCAADNSTSGKSAPGLDAMYSADCEITCREADDEEFICAGKIVRLGGGCWELELASPDTVKGLKINMGEEGMTASLGDLSFRIETEKIPSRAAFVTVFGVLDRAAEGDLGFIETETELCYKGKYGEESFTLKYEKASNTLCGLECGNVSAEFGGFCISEAPAPAETSASAETSVTEENTAEPGTAVTAPVSADRE